MILDQRHENSRGGERGVVERVREMHFAVGAAVAEVRAPRLPVVQGRAAVGLAIFAQTRHPALDIVHAELAQAHVAGRGFDHLIGDLQRMQQLFGKPEQLGMPLGRLRVVGLADHILLDLHELMDAQQPAHVLARAPRLAAETRRVTGVEDRQFVGIDDFARMERGQHHLGGPGEPQIVVGELVGFLLVARKLPLVEERLLARNRRNRNRGEAGPRDLLQRPRHELGLEQGERALETVGPRTRDWRDPRQIAPVVLLDQRDVVERLEIELRRLALGADNNVEAFVRPNRRPFIRNAGELQHQRFQLRFLGGELAFERRCPRARLLRLAPERCFFFRARVLEFGADRVALGPQRLDLGLCRPDRTVETEQPIKVEIDTLVADRALNRLAVRLDEIQSQHWRLLA